MEKECYGNGQTAKAMDDCCARTEGSGKNAFGFTSLMGGLVIALLPKCPFCILAYSSAVAMCSGAAVSDHAPGWISLLSVGLALVVIYTLFRNYRGRRTLLAIFLALTGAGFIGYAEFLTGDLGVYYLGSFMILGAALLNGGIYVFLSRLFGIRKLFASR